MKTIFSFRTIFILPAMLIILTGCSVREDMDDCGSMRLSVMFDPGMYELPTGEHHIDNIDIYGFDTDGRCVYVYRGGEYDYSSGKMYHVPVDLLPGKYTFIAWTNTGEDYKTDPARKDVRPGITFINDLGLYLDGSADHLFETDIPDLHYGRLEGAVFDRSKNTEYIIYLIPDTYRINVTVKGLDEDADQFAISVSDDNGHYDFLNRIVAGYGDYRHLRNCNSEEGMINTSMRLLSLTDDHAIENIGMPGTADRTPVLKLTNRTTDTELFAEDMVKMIRRAYSDAGKTVDFDKTYTFDIILSFDANMEVTVSVDGWSYRHNPIEL